LGDFYERFRKHAKEYGDTLMTEKFYQISEWDEERYRQLRKHYDFHVDFVEDLMLELTRAANLIADCVRETFMRNYRLAKAASWWNTVLRRRSSTANWLSSSVIAILPIQVSKLSSRNGYSGNSISAKAPNLKGAAARRKAPSRGGSSL
jgi:hypothetical protein